MSKHTPGPWIVVEGFMGKYEVESANDRDTGDPCVKFTIARDIGGRVHGEGFDDYSEVEANIKLIAAAPDLVEALEVMVGKARKQNWNDNYPVELQKAVDAIAKAKGNQP